jgi:hypothetical protein
MEKRDLVLKAIMERYGSLTTLIECFRDDVDTVCINLADDTDFVLDEYEIEDIVRQIIS